MAAAVVWVLKVEASGNAYAAHRLSALSRRVSILVAFLASALVILADRIVFM